jgi:hypothetical protein
VPGGKCARPRQPLVLWPWLFSMAWSPHSLLSFPLSSLHPTSHRLTLPPLHSASPHSSPTLLPVNLGPCPWQELLVEAGITTARRVVYPDVPGSLEDDADVVKIFRWNSIWGVDGTEATSKFPPLYTYVRVG